MAPAAKKSEDRIGKAERQRRGPAHIILQTLPALSFSTPTHTIRLQLTFQPPSAQDKMSANSASNVVAHGGQRDVDTLAPPPAAELHQVIRDVASLKVQFDQLTTKVDGLTTKVDGLTTKVDGLTTKVDNLTTKLDSLTTKVDNMAKENKESFTQIINMLRQLSSHRRLSQDTFGDTSSHSALSRSTTSDLSSRGKSETLSPPEVSPTSRNVATTKSSTSSPQPPRLSVVFPPPRYSPESILHSLSPTARIRAGGVSSSRKTSHGAILSIPTVVVTGETSIPTVVVTGETAAGNNKDQDRDQDQDISAGNSPAEPASASAGIEQSTAVSGGEAWLATPVEGPPNEDLPSAPPSPSVSMFVEEGAIAGPSVPVEQPHLPVDQHIVPPHVIQRLMSEFESEAEA
ncbi:hypothetical protein BC628DRAFT_1422744 [Trametes gibbosa]|nr:hypothetical protein BC628DRAFT_1422744 [Trametes gibbosa]